jgi:hypothetical protein
MTKGTATPVVIDTMTYSKAGYPRSSRADIFWFSGGFSDRTRVRLQKKIFELTGCDMDRPIAAVGWNPSVSIAAIWCCDGVAMGLSPPLILWTSA